MSDQDNQVNEVDALVIGAGFAGLYQLHCLRDRLGLNTTVLEAADGVGGTWYWNRYPGARCDSESHAYCYFFSRELFEEWEWSERFPSQAEVLRYLNHVADRFDLSRDIKLSTRVTSATWREDEARWLVNTHKGICYKARYLITAVGCLSSANVPDIEGLQKFQGEWYHTGQWPHDGVDFAGKRVGQIGTGSTGIQTAPVIAETARHLTVFQRTANYSVPANNHPLSDEFKEYVRDNMDEIREIAHSTSGGHPFPMSKRKVFDVSPEERREIYEKAWEVGGLRFRSSFEDLLASKASNDTAAEFIKSKIREIVADPATAERLSNIDHPYAAKRPPIDTNYFATFNRENVSLVDVHEEPIERITPYGIQTQRYHHDLDVIVFATGFDAITGPLLKLRITGAGGQSLQQAWAEGPKTWLGLMVPGFPNMFTVTGPGSPSVLTNMPVAIEQHVEWIADCIAHLEARGARVADIGMEQAESWAEHCTKMVNLTLLPQAHHSWYLGANVPGKPRVFMPYAGGMVGYRGICDDVAAAGYRELIVETGNA